MKFGKEIIAFIDEYMDNCLKRPEMYAAAPYALEQVLMVLDMIRCFAPDDKRVHALSPYPYSDYLMEKGFTATTSVACKVPEPPLTEQDEVLFREVADSWKDYLSRRTCI